MFTVDVKQQYNNKNNNLLRMKEYPFTLNALTLFFVARDTIVKCLNLFNIGGVNSGKSDFFSEIKNYYLCLCYMYYVMLHLGSI